MMLGLAGAIQDWPLAASRALRVAVGGIIGLFGGIVVAVALVVLELALIALAAAHNAVLPQRGVSFGKAAASYFLLVAIHDGSFVAGWSLVLGILAGALEGVANFRRRHQAAGLATRRNLCLAGIGVAALVLAVTISGNSSAAVGGALVYALAAGALMDGLVRRRFGHGAMSLLAVLGVGDLALLARAFLGPLPARAGNIVVIACIMLIFGYFGYTLFRAPAFAGDLPKRGTRLRVFAWGVAGTAIGLGFINFVAKVLASPGYAPIVGCVIGVFVALGSPDGKTLLAAPRERLDPPTTGADAGPTRDEILKATRFTFNREISRRRFWNAFIVGGCYVTVTLLLLEYYFVIVRDANIIPGVLGSDLTMSRWVVYVIMGGGALVAGASFGTVFGFLNGYRRAAFDAFMALSRGKPGVVVVVAVLAGFVASGPGLALFVSGH
jgi:hypothetical protein